MDKFSALSIKDLLDARDLYHIHLMNRKNVIATAVGRYLIRKSDPWLEQNDERHEKPNVKKVPRDLENSEVRPYSWPCILVFVERWVDYDQFGYDVSGSKVAPEDIVPKTLFLPDGREVPVCVVLAHKDEPVPASVDVRNLVFPKNVIGGGYPVISTVQGQDHIASIGCLVTDGHLTYALTNRHVSGEPGEVLYTFLDGEKVPIGKSSRKYITRKCFSEIYKTWPGKDVFVNLDIGLVEIDDLNSWTAQIYGIGPIGEMVDLSDENVTLELIGCKVKAFGCASRQMRGEICGLYYRYKALGGYEYVADFLIGKQSGEDSPPFVTNRGDSATVWLLEKGDRPIAIQWGGHVFLDGTKKVKSHYALATCLSTVCNLLEVDLVRDLNIGLESYWGGMGHYTIGNIACDIVKNERLKQLMQANQRRISFKKEQLTDKNIRGLSKKPFVPLADVADLVWKIGHTTRRYERSNHFADMDKPGGDGKNLIEICEGHPENVSLDVWRAYYDEIEDESRGLLPFRVWQIYDAMVEFVRQGRIAEFICAAGVLAHYVGDCTNPLHISYMYDGDPDDTVKATVKDRKTGGMKEVDQPRAKGIHSAFENDVMKYHSSEILVKMEELARGNVPMPGIRGGQAAAVAMYDLMKDVYYMLPPVKLIDAYNDVDDKRQKRVAADALWDSFSDQTVKILFNACRYLALMWDSAWEEGDGDNTIGDLGEIDEDTLSALYLDKEFLPSYTLDNIGSALM